MRNRVTGVAPAGGGPPGELPGPPGYTMWPYAGTTFTKGGRAPGGYTMNCPGEPAGRHREQLWVLLPAGWAEAA